MGSGEPCAGPLQRLGRVVTWPGSIDQGDNGSPAAWRADWKRANTYYLCRAGNGETTRLKEAGPGQAPSRTGKGHQSRVAPSAWGYLEGGSFIVLRVSSVIAHVGNWPPIGFGVIWFAAYCIGNQDRSHYGLRSQLVASEYGVRSALTARPLARRARRPGLGASQRSSTWLPADTSSALNVVRLRVQAPHDPKLEPSLVLRAEHRKHLINQADQRPGHRQQRQQLIAAASRSHDGLRAFRLQLGPMSL